MTTVVFGHPWRKSFNYAILQTVLAALISQGKEHTLIDLYADGFDPAVSEADLALYGAGSTADPLARKYMGIIKATDEIIFIYPVWWGVEPAIIQGFYDKVLLKDFAWKYSPEGRLLPLLNIPSAKIFTTSDAPGEVFSQYFLEYLPAHVFAAVGIGRPLWLNMPNIPRSTQKERGDFLAAIAKATTKEWPEENSVPAPE